MPLGPRRSDRAALTLAPTADTKPDVEKGKCIWMNGTMVPWDDAKVHVLTHTLHYGVGAFEGIRCYECADGRSAVFRLREHIVRLVQSCKILDIESPYSVDELVEREVEARESLLQVELEHRDLGRLGRPQLAHEALIREWPELRRWLDEDRAALRVTPLLWFLTTFWPIRMLSRGLIGFANVILPGKGLKEGPFVTEAEIRQLYDLLKFGPTAANSCPARFQFVRSAPAMPAAPQRTSRPGLVTSIRRSCACSRDRKSVV